ncbi:MULTISPECIES: hypothetical protein [Hymenobacter]|uniref:DUF4177 domain-containing protein n=1 Tax=Hymenobacter guriensis TaxID=2793065 RepID=A0ABS0KY96_9BACT|nr:MULTISPECIES: hypothetical protein [Hymenobacter]MBG8552830.1 hypothetical protein [Hymenobacter guriensis]MCR5888701.1 cupredoxin domain-containing protein [Hymenobacter sp. J193]
MKKALSFMALALVSIGTWAFYPKSAADEATGYMLLTLRNGAGRPMLVLTPPTGEPEEITLSKQDKSAYRYESQLVKKLNELRAQGWVVVQMQSSDALMPGTTYPAVSTDIVSTKTFLLEKR